MDFIQSKPKGIARDFYIYEMLQGGISTKDAIKLYDLIERKSGKIITLLKEKIPSDLLPKDLYCKGLSFKELLQSDDSCFNLGFRLDYAFKEKLDKKTLSRISNPNTINHIKILQSKSVLDTLLQASGEDFATIYFALSNKQEIFNHSSKNLKFMSNKNFNKAIYHLIVSQKYPNFTKALLKEDIVGVNDWTFFALALNELQNGSKHKADKYFAQASKITKIPLLRDRAIFWRYKITNDISLLEVLAQSKNFNLYSLYATKKLQVSPQFEIITMDSPIFSALDESMSPFDIESPFEWQILRQNIALVKDKEALLDIAKLFYYKDTLPHFVYVLERYYNYSKNFFLTPYDDLDIDTQTKPLLYAVAKQESKFIPSVVSSSYALGMLQIIPSNVAPFAQEMKRENITKYDMFKPSIALYFGEYYLKHLSKEFSHPLFIAYAYNGGPTFIRNLLKNPAVFSKNNKYDPWLSMEFIPYEESRFYGMFVMANYIIYNAIAGNDIDIEVFFNESLR